MAFALFAALTQCKKEAQVASIDNNGEAVAITLDIKGNGSTRMDVNTVSGAVTYENGDVIYVANGGRYIGTLTYDGTQFNGTITDPVVGEPLHFYFLGNVTPAENLTAGITQTCSVIISDQSEHLPVIEYAPSNENYVSGATTFSAKLLNKCALVKFNVESASAAPISITGMNNKVAVDFSENTMAYSMEGTGVITLSAGAGQGERWAILLPQEAVEAGVAGSAYSTDGVYMGTRGAVQAITDNAYLSVGINVTVTTEVNPGEVPVGAINGKFTINSNGDQVYFAQGNLQYIGSASNPYWKFAEHQWDYLGTTTGQNSSNQNVDRDLFGWGTSGWNNGNMYYQPYNTEANNEEYEIGYGYGPTDGVNYTYDLTGAYANADWGVNNAISNGGNVPGIWRTLTNSQWSYVFNTRSTISGIRFAKAVVNGHNGVILLPDNWASSIYTLKKTNKMDAYYTSNQISLSVWMTMEANGAVFLPAAGNRIRTSVYDEGEYGNYWSSSYHYTYFARSVYFFNESMDPTDEYQRHNGFSVRLVHSVQ